MILIIINMKQEELEDSDWSPKTDSELSEPQWSDSNIGSSSLDVALNSEMQSGRSFKEEKKEDIRTPKVLIEEEKEAAVLKVPYIPDQVKAWKDLLKLYCKAAARNLAYLPHYNSPLGQNIPYLEGILEGKIFTVREKSICWMKISEAPGDAVLFEMLKQAKAGTLEYKNKNFGYELDVLPDTAYMINMIFFFNKHSALRFKRLDLVPYYPTDFW